MHNKTDHLYISLTHRTQTKRVIYIYITSRLQEYIYICKLCSLRIKKTSDYTEVFLCKHITNLWVIKESFNNSNTTVLLSTVSCDVLCSTIVTLITLWTKSRVHWRDLIYRSPDNRPGTWVCELVPRWLDWKQCGVLVLTVGLQPVVVM